MSTAVASKRSDSVDPELLSSSSTFRTESKGPVTSYKTSTIHDDDDDDPDNFYKTLQLCDFDVFAISGAHQNCLYRCVVLGCNEKMLKNYKTSQDNLKTELDQKARALRQNVATFGRKELENFENVASVHGFDEILKERKCRSLSEAIDQIDKRNVPADVIDMTLLVNLLTVKLVIFRFVTNNGLFHHLGSFSPQKEYLRDKNYDNLPVVFVKHNQSSNVANEPGDHFELLILKQKDK